MILPEILLAWRSPSPGAVLVVEPTRYAAEKVADSFINFRRWSSEQVQLRTGTHREDEFIDGTTRISVITYGLLWKWLTGGSCAQLMRRYKGFVLDEFAKVMPCTGS